jgi:bacterioferritin-associated ferredoxin
MYICVCKAVTDRQINQAIEQGACTRRQLYQTTGVGGVCGKCALHVKEMLDQKRSGELIMEAA